MTSLTHSYCRTRAGGVGQDHVHPIVADSALLSLCKVHRDLACPFFFENGGSVSSDI